MAAVRVEPEVVRQLGQELAGVASALADGAAVLGRRGAVASGEPALVLALDDLARTWREGLARLASEATATARALHDADAGYRQVETAVAGSCR